MAHDHLVDRDPEPARYGGDEPVHLAVELQVLHHFGPEGLQRASIVVKMDAGGHGDEPVRDLGWKRPGEKRVLPVLPPAAHHVESRVEPLDQARDVPGIVLQVGVQGHDDRGPRFGEARGQRRGLAEVLAEPNDAHALVAVME